MKWDKILCFGMQDHKSLHCVKYFPNSHSIYLSSNKIVIIINDNSGVNLAQVEPGHKVLTLKKTR